MPIPYISSGPSLHLGTGPITASDHVRLLGVTVSSDLSLEKHVSGICSTCFCWLRHDTIASGNTKYMVQAVVSAHDVKHQAYADDTQLYLRCRAQEATTAAHRLEVCITDVQRWMEANRLKLNADKTELLWAGSRYGPALLGSSGPSLDLGTGPIRDHVRLLGVTISSDLSLEKHVSGIFSTCFYWFRQIRRIRRSLDTTSATTLVMLSLRLVLTTVTPYWLGRLGLLPTGFSVC